MRTLVGLLLVAVASSLAAAQPDPKVQERQLRVVQIVDELAVDDDASARVIPVLTRYFKDTALLRETLAGIRRSIAREADPQQLDKLYDQQVATTRALLSAETGAVTKLRKILPAPKAARARLALRVLPGGTVIEDPELPATTAVAAPIAPYSHDPSTLFPPSSKLVPPCDPFASMHGCPR
jgi:hypothetical protein